MSLNLTEAIAAANCQDWLKVNQSLQELTMTSMDIEEFDRWLDLALRVLIEGDFTSRWDIAKIVPKLGKKVIAPLTEILADEDEDVECRWFAGRILSSFTEPSALIALVELLHHTDEPDLIEMVAQALGEIGIGAIDTLSQLLIEPEYTLLSVRALGQIRHSQTIAPLLTVIDHPEPLVRTFALEALSSFHAPEIPPILINKLQDLSASVRQAAITGLGLRADLQTELNLINHLVPLLYDFNLDVCLTAAVSLSRMGDKAAPYLYECLVKPTTPPPLQEKLIRALSWCDNSLSLNYLRQALTKAPISLIITIIDHLGRNEHHQAAAAQILQDYYYSLPPEQHLAEIDQAVAVAWGNLGESTSVDPLIQMLANGEKRVQFHAIAALKKIATPTTHEHLQQLYIDSATPTELRQGIGLCLSQW